MKKIVYVVQEGTAVHVYPKPPRKKRVNDGTKMVSMLTYDGVTKLFTDYVKNFGDEDQPTMASLVTRSMKNSSRPHKVTIIVEEVKKVVVKKTIKAITANEATSA